MRFAVLAAIMLGTGLAHAHTLDAGAQETVPEARDIRLPSMS
jgi:hypothetical protein